MLQKTKIYTKRVLFAIWKFIVFFLMIAFVVTCNFSLFFKSVNLDPEEVRLAAPITFVNVLFITLLFCIIDGVRRMWSVSRPVKRIQEGINKIISGDFSTRISYIRGENSSNQFDLIIRGLNEMAVELSGLETLRADFISNVSHELKTPLSVIQNYSTLLGAKDLSDEKRTEYSKAITTQTRKLSSLITNILKLNKLENQQIFPEKKLYNLTEQICACLLDFEHIWEEKDIEIQTDLQEDVMVNSDAELLSLVWNNLFSNALKFTDAGGKVSIGLHKEGNQVFVMVKDTGCGINPDIGKHIFEKFYQADTSHSTQGNGLGLALVKRVVDIINGDIQVQSILGEGSTFIVCIKEYSH